jgi:thioredoxin-related protein
VKIHTGLIGALLALLLGAQVQAAEPPTLGGLSLLSIEDGRSQRIDSLAKGPLLMSFFEPDCTWCARQIRDLEAAKTQCAKPLPFALVGVHGDRMELRLMLRRAKAGHLPAHVASPALLEALDGIPATPHAVILDAQGHPLVRMRGYIPLAKLCEIADLLANAQ